MTNKLDISNMALSAAYARSTMADINEVSEEGRVVRLWYDTVLAHLHRAGNWSFARDVVDLSLLATPSSGSWSLRYALPTNCLRARYLEGYASFTISGTNVLTNEVDARLVFTKLVDNPDNWDATFRMAMVYALAAHICGPLTGKIKKASELIANANMLIREGMAETANEGYQFVETLPDWLVARNVYEGVPGNKPFIIPPGPDFPGIEP